LDSAGMRFQKIALPPRGTHQVSQLIDYEAFCQTPSQMSNIPQVTPKELKTLFDQADDFQLIDVREPYEHEYCNIGGELIPMGQILTKMDQINRHRRVVI
ncbi:hypothetical protein RZS08_46630, partial [Arthrospira platensis SPKY1]|nr:hypothetical protein [Arthrospira platensis SPKY1]